MAAGPGPRPSLVEPVAALALFLAIAAVLVVTYARLPAGEVYNTDVDGVRGGFGRVLVWLNFPVALLVPGVVGIVAARARERLVDVLALAAVVLAAVVAFPGVVEQSDLDAKAVNAIPALGVLAALLLTVWVASRRGVGTAPRRVPLDPLRLVLAVVIVLASIPWIAAYLGFYAGLGGLFMSSEVVPEPGHPTIRAVHLGAHHGFDGALLALTALALTRELGRIVSTRLRLAVTAYLSLLFVYGLTNAVQDFWLEQLYKRGTVDVKLPSVVLPHLNAAWLAMLVVAAVLAALLARVYAPRTPA